MLRTRTWIIIISALLLVCTALSVFLLTMKRESKIALVTVHGEVLREIDLSKVTQEYSFTVETQEGKNEITVQPGRICVSSADCPDKICVQSGWLSDSAAPIVCAPHGLIIKLKDAPTDA